MSCVTHSMSIRSCDTSWTTPVRITTGISVPSSICSARLASPTVFRCMASGKRLGTASVVTTMPAKREIPVSRRTIWVCWASCHPISDRGFGKALVAATKELARCSADSRGILLNTETEKNIPYYEKLGFRVVGEADADHVHTWSMFWSCE